MMERCHDARKIELKEMWNTRLNDLAISAVWYVLPTAGAYL